MKLNDFLDVLVAQSENCSVEKLYSFPDLKAKRNNKYKSLTDRISLVFPEFSDITLRGNKALWDDFSRKEYYKMKIKYINEKMDEQNLLTMIMLNIIEIYMLSKKK